MTLGEKQRLFTRYVGYLIVELYALGYEASFGDAYRSPEEAARLAKLGLGIAKSLHTSRLAIDLNLFKDGLFLTRTDDYQILGEWWEKQHPLCRWGGHFNDGNHFSMEHDGRK